MSGAEIIALAAVVVSGIVGLATLGFNFWNSSSERTQRLKERAEDRAEWYQRTIFERRLEALTREYAWIMELFRLRTRVEFQADGALQELRDRAKEAREWYEHNALFLYESLPTSSEFVDWINRSVDEEFPRFGGEFNQAMQSNRNRVETFLISLRAEASSEERKA